MGTTGQIWDTFWQKIGKILDCKYTGSPKMEKWDKYGIFFGKNRKNTGFFGTKWENMGHKCNFLPFLALLQKIQYIWNKYGKI